MNKFYKVVWSYKNRMFSMNSSTCCARKLINKQKKFYDSTTVEYKLGKWTHKPKIALWSQYQRKLFVYDNLDAALDIARGFYCFQVYECEVKNPVNVNHSPYQANLDHISLVDAVKLTKQIY